MDPSSRDETQAQTAPSAGGRPRRWGSAAEKHRAHRKRQAERQRLLGELLLAVRNASHDDRELHRTAQDEDDLTLLHALVRHYQERHWQRPRKEACR